MRQSEESKTYTIPVEELRQLLGLSNEWQLKHAALGDGLLMPDVTVNIRFTRRVESAEAETSGVSIRLARHDDTSEAFQHGLKAGYEEGLKAGSAVASIKSWDER